VRGNHSRVYGRLIKRKEKLCVSARARCEGTKMEEGPSYVDARVSEVLAWVCMWLCHGPGPIYQMWESSLSNDGRCAAKTRSGLAKKKIPQKKGPKVPR
jgi:hypothetical protein